MSETSDVSKWLKFHTGAPVIADSSIASFALIAIPRTCQPLDRFAFGSNEYPDRSTTLILQVESLTQGAAFELRGPGIDGTAILRARSSRMTCSIGLPSTSRCFRAASTSCWFMTTPLSRSRARRGSSPGDRGRLSMYVAVKGGERAIDNAHRLLADERRGDRDVPELSLDQIAEQLALAVDRVMTEGSLYDRELAALAIKQARGDLIEAIFLVRAYRTTCRASAHPSRSTPAACRCDGASRRPSRTCRAARCSGRPSTTPIACSISLLAGRRHAGRARDRRRLDGGDAARDRHSRPRGADRAATPSRCRRAASAT